MKAKEEKPIQKKMFKLIRTVEGFSIYRIGKSTKISERDMRGLNLSMQENADMRPGEELIVFTKYYKSEEPAINVPTTYVKLAPGVVDPSLQ